MSTATRYGEAAPTHYSSPDVSRCTSQEIDTRPRAWIRGGTADLPAAPVGEVFIDTNLLLWLQGGTIGPAQKAVLEILEQSTSAFSPPLSAFGGGVKCVATVEMKPANDPGSLLASDVFVRRVAPLCAALVDAIVKAWGAGSEYQTIHPIKVAPHGSISWNEPDPASRWEQLVSREPGSTIEELSCAELYVSFEGELCTLDEVASRKRNLVREILNRALERYHQPDGYEGSLVDAAWEVEQIGPEAWPALWDLVMAGGPECEYFLAAVVRLEGVDPKARRKALLTAARNPHPDVRSRLLELLEEMPDQLRAEVLWELIADGRPDDGVTDRAREVWHAQAV